MARNRPIFIPTKPPQCCGKNRYFSRFEAEKVAEEQMILRPFLSLGVYACTCGCHGWHLTRLSVDSATHDV